MKNNKQMIKKLMNRNFKNHLLRNFLLIAVVSVITLLVTALRILSTTTYKNMERNYLEQYGNAAHGVVSGISEVEYEKIETYEKISDCGKSIYIGEGTNSEFGGRPTEVRFADQIYAEYALALPEEGRMPTHRNEIALDSTILKELGNKQLGDKVTLSFPNKDNTNEEFTVVGSWNGSDLRAKRVIWVSEEMVLEGSDTYDIAITFNRGKDWNSMFSKMMKELDIEGKELVLNSVYDASLRSSMGVETMPYKVGILLVLICELLVLYNIIHITAMTDIKLYGRLKIVGATDGQLRYVFLRQISIITISGIVIGLGMGSIIGTFLVDSILGRLENIMVYQSSIDFFTSALMILGVAVLCCIKPIHFICNINTDELLQSTNSHDYNKKTRRAAPSISSLFQMSIGNLGRFKKRNTLTFIMMVVALVVLSGIYVIEQSFDIDKYMDEVAISNYTITEKTAVTSWGDYNSQGDTISTELINDLLNTDEISEKGTLYMQDTAVVLSDVAYENITRYYEKNNGEILDYMAQNYAWIDGYERMKTEHQCTAIIYGIDGVVTDRISERVVDGIIDKEKFSSGDYIIAQGSIGGDFEEQQPNFKVGELVEIDGKKYEVMAIVDAQYPIIEGKEMSGAEFHIDFYMPNLTFQILFPRNTPKKFFFNTKNGKSEKVNAIINKYNQDDELQIITQDSIEKNYKDETRAATLIQKIIAIMMTIIGIVNLINLIFNSINSRKKEFVLMQGLGMTKKQLATMLLFEGTNMAAIILVTSYFLSIISITTVVKFYIESQWTATYSFSLAPLIVMTPFIILLSVGIPLVIWKLTAPKEIADTLNDAEL
ncbi:putative ABC transport system permease protein [Aequitasia blattaphilus]|uniref:ABC transporter permease n=1 Tax=Aequitasia blattaphilus TaxID=2949332 RepID=A0ABT1EFV8_9FIRM|nr:ABC transporter permease [Aequitasia blattaphilus]MCP1103342.1 ABC transporter permease [Aequitasia blattaphilus]MCR8615982.1 ABC transporter permease [Aequitasia blattaphilus]